MRMIFCIPFIVWMPLCAQHSFPNYSTEEVHFINSAADSILFSGTLTLPESKAKELVILISGSGPQNRDEEILGHKPFQVIADYLSRRHVAVLRYDDRGVEKSGGNFGLATTKDFASDVEAAISYVKSREDLKNLKLGLIGHSEGAMIAPMVASNNQAVEFIILLAGPGIPSDELLLLQNRLIMQANKSPQQVIEYEVETLRQVNEVILQSREKSAHELKKELVPMVAERLKGSFRGVGRSEEGIELLAERSVRPLLTQWFRYCLAFEPAVYLSQIRCPVLALNGTLDLQVPAKENLAAIDSILQSAGNNQIEIKALEGLNHLFQKAETGSPSEYGLIRESFNEEALEVMEEWIRKME